MLKRLVLCLVAALAAQPARAEPANTLRELGARLQACLAGVRLVGDADVTVVFSLKRDGSLNGRPRLSYAKLPGDQAARQADARAIAEGLDACLPIAITGALGGAIAGRPMSVRIGRKVESDT